MDRKKQYYEVITDAWNLLKQNIDQVDYDRIAAEVHELDGKYHGTPEYTFANDVIVAVMEEITRIHG